jgi:hypothetical protein
MAGARKTAIAISIAVKISTLAKAHDHENGCCP